MKRILCFGDSLTWGFNPATRTRFDEDSRWPCVMQQALAQLGPLPPLSISGLLSSKRGI